MKKIAILAVLVMSMATSHAQTFDFNCVSEPTGIIENIGRPIDNVGGEWYERTDSTSNQELFFVVNDSSFVHLFVNPNDAKYHLFSQRTQTENQYVSTVNNTIRFTVYYGENFSQSFTTEYAMSLTDKRPIIATNEGFDNDPIYSRFDVNNSSNWLNLYIEDAAREGVDLSYLRGWETNIGWADREQFPGSSPAGFADVSCIPRGSSRYNSLFYAFAPKYQSMLTVWHEFGHAYLKLRHVCDAQDIMYTYQTSIFCPNGATGENPGHRSNDVDVFRNGARRMFQKISQGYYCEDSSSSKRAITNNKTIVGKTWKCGP